MNVDLYIGVTDQAQDLVYSGKGCCHGAATSDTHRMHEKL